MSKYKDIDMYHYIFHYSHYRENDKQWACIHREDLNFYFNGTEPNGELNKLKIGYADTPEKAFENAKINLLNETGKTI